MKKLFAFIPLSMMLAACASTSSPTMPMKDYNAPLKNGMQQITKAYDRMAAQKFVCEDDAQVYAKYSIDGQEAQVTASLPKAKWNNQSLVMTIAPSGSGARYVNTDNSNVSYDWHTKADEGIMSIQWADGNEYSVNCELVK